MKTGIRIEFQDLAKRYDLRVIFRAISGTALPAEVLVLSGPNGSGKSTLMTILCGLQRPTKGATRYWRGDSEIPRRQWRREIGVVAPSMAMYEELDAMENLRFFARVRGLSWTADELAAILRKVGLDPERRTQVRGFSTGMHQRLKIAQAMLHQPSVLFLDEPGSNLDPQGQDWLEGWINERLEMGTTVILATNDRREMAWGTRHVALSA